MSELLREKIRAVPDFPKQGVVYRDITSLLGDGRAFKATIDAFVARYRDRGVQKIVAIESRGYLLGAPLAHALGVGLALVRKAGALPHGVDREAALELHTDALAVGETVVVVDDLLATGGTAEAAGKLVARRGAKVLEYAFLVELVPLAGRARLGAANVFALLDY